MVGVRLLHGESESESNRAKMADQIEKLFARISNQVVLISSNRSYDPIFSPDQLFFMVTDVCSVGNHKRIV